MKRFFIHSLRKIKAKDKRGSVVVVVGLSSFWVGFSVAITSFSLCLWNLFHTFHFLYSRSKMFDEIESSSSLLRGFSKVYLTLLLLKLPEQQDRMWSLQFHSLTAVCLPSSAPQKLKLRRPAYTGCLFPKYRRNITKATVACVKENETNNFWLPKILFYHFVVSR